MVEFETVRQLIGELLQLDDERLAQIHCETPLQGAIPEFDSMAVVALLIVYHAEALVRGLRTMSWTSRSETSAALA